MRHHHLFLLVLSVLLMLVVDTLCAQAPQWRVLPNAPVRSSRHDDVFFVDAQNGWVVNGGGQIYATTDGGDSWQLQFTAPAYCRSVGFATPVYGWAGTLNSAHVLYRTTDGGASWSEVTDIPQPRPHGICGISVVTSTVVYASGKYEGPARVIKTINRGLSWSSIDMSAYAGALVDCYFFSPDSGFVVGGTDTNYAAGYSKVLFTSDGGNSWAVRHTGTRSGELCWKIVFRTRLIGYVSLEKFQSGSTYYLKTTDGGLTWSDELFMNSLYDVQGIGFLGDSLGWIGGWSGNTYATTDAGASWHLAGFGFNVNRFRFLSNNLAYAVGQTVYKYSADTSAVGIPWAEGTFPPFSIDQNYPNPFNPSTVIRYTISVAGPVKLEVYDVLGERIETLVDETEPPGNYNATWNGETHPSGIYFYRLTTNTSIQTRKMVLVK